MNGMMRNPKTLPPDVMAASSYSNGAFDLPSLEHFQELQVVVSTAVTAGYLASLGVPPGHFTHIFVDEAGEAMVSEALIPLQLAHSNTITVLAGDPQQP